MERVARTLLPFKIALTRSAPDVTAHAGLPLVVEAARSVLARRMYKRLARAIKWRSWKRARRAVETVLVLVAAGGDCIDDVGVLRRDNALRDLLGFRLMCASDLKEFFYRFHQADNGRELRGEDDDRLSVAGRAQIRPEGPGLCRLEDMANEVVRKLQAARQRETATLDVDASIIEAHKRRALKAYDGTVGYQPQMAWWAEQSVWVRDEFRDGNVPAAFSVRDFIERSFEAVAGSVRQRRLRGDSALYDEDALTWLDDEHIEFAVSADMSEGLLKAIKAIRESEWKQYRTLKPYEDDPSCGEERQCAEVADFVPDWKRNRKKSGQAFRYVAIRVRPRQRDLLDDGSSQWRHFSVVTNMGWEAERLLRWQREKLGTVEHAHGVLKNDLAAGTMPFGRFGANAAWLRLNVLAANLLEYIKAVSLPPEMAPMRPKALRFRLLNIAGRIVRGARRLSLILAAGEALAALYQVARERLAVAARASPA